MKTALEAIWMAICSCPDSETPEPFVLVNVQIPNKAGAKRWFGRDGLAHSWDELRNPIILSEGLK